MIARVWRGATLAENGDAYAAYIEESGVGPARKLTGNRGSLVLRRVEGGHTHFETILLFDSLEDVRAFAGDDLEAARSSRKTTGISSSATSRCATTRST